MLKKDWVRKIRIRNKDHYLADIMRLERDGVADIRRLPFSIRILVENLLRKMDGRRVTEKDLLHIARWKKRYASPQEIPFHPARVLMQDFTGVPAVVDLAAMRDAVKTLGGDPRKINPLVPVDLIIDHSIQVDSWGTRQALTENVAREYQRNGERYALLKWAQASFNNFLVVPPNAGICHQVNLENIGRVIMTETAGGRLWAYPDTVVGLDSHTTMINGVGVVGWGVGGIEAEAVMLGQPYYMAIPEVIGVRLTGALSEGVTATDLVLTVTEMLRRRGVVEKFVEFFGPGMRALRVPDRATIANMAPEYGATIGFFPVDEQVIDYLHLTNRAGRAEMVEKTAKALGLFCTGSETPEYTQVLELDLGGVEPSVAGPARPQDRIRLPELKGRFATVLGCDYERDADAAHISTYHQESGTGTLRPEGCRPKRKACEVVLNGNSVRLCDGDVAIAAITSCTNTSNPHVLMGAGLLAQKAVEHGLRVPVTVKTSLAPGSKVVIDYLKAAGLLPYLEALGFHLAAFGCTTCIGNSGPLLPEIEEAISRNDLTVAAVLSGNRNFEARIHQRVKANFLMSPMLVVAFALAGRVDIDLTSDPLGRDPQGRPVFLREIWPSQAEIDALVARHVQQKSFRQHYSRISKGDEFWRRLEVKASTTYAWDETSTYIRNPPYFAGFSLDPGQPADILEARVLMLLGDMVTTDHISPAGAIPAHYPAGQYLISQGVEPKDFNSYGARRGNHEVMMRGTFGNIRIKNRMVAPKEGSFTLEYPEGRERFAYEAAMAYRTHSVPLVILGGREYGAGSSRDWAAKGPSLLGVRAVICESFERIHRSNLVGMGVLPLVFKEGRSAQRLGLDGSERITIKEVAAISPRATLPVTAVKPDGRVIAFEVTARLDMDIEVDYFIHGGILPYVLRRIMTAG
ncbi:MAG: aconitate hydratase AcnA [Desulfobacterales bacterium]|jgi:aconitate hydratase|nr:aconitate hydratase AcnA [Desulfobacterales bacterium]